MSSRARTKEGDKAYRLYKKLIQERVTPNLQTTHPPFQIDANFGALAGVTEMLIQSHEDFIELLPAIPRAWKTGEYKGLVARGNFEFSVKWENGEVTNVEMISRSGGECKLLFNTLHKMDLTHSFGKKVQYKKESNGTISFQTTKGKHYLLNNQSNEFGC